LFGKMPNKSILSDIDYYQSFARTKSGSIGIKVWIFFYTKSYDSQYLLNSFI
jgi:ribosomal protein S3